MQLVGPEGTTNYEYETALGKTAVSGKCWRHGNTVPVGPIWFGKSSKQNTTTKETVLPIMLLASASVAFVRFRTYVLRF